MTTMLDLVNETRRTVYGTLSETVNFVSSTYTAGDTTLTLELPIQGVLPGATVSSGLNVWVVKNVTGQVLSVHPGLDGAPDTDCAVGDFVYIRPRVTNWQIFDMLNREIVRLYSPDVGLYGLDYWDTLTNVYNQTYPLPDDLGYPILNIIRARYIVPGFQDVWYDLQPSNWRVDRVNDLIQSFVALPITNAVQFWYRRGFKVATSLADDPVEDCGLAATMTDIPVLGAIEKLLLTTESRRGQVQSQGDSRKANEVPSGSNSASSRYYARMWQSRVDEEYARLLASAPIYQGTS